MPPPTPVVSNRLSMQHLGPNPALVVPGDVYSDARTHGPQGPTRQVRLSRATSSGGGAIAKSEDLERCVVAGRESLRILRITAPSAGGTVGLPQHRFATGQGGYRIEASHNLWEGSGLHVESASTDVIWGHGTFSNKIVTSARNGELIMWDLNKPGMSKFERRTRDHSRSIHALAYSPFLKYYCLTGSADGDLRVWDLRDLSRSIMWIRHPAGVRAVAFSPVHWQPLQAITASDNGSIYRWDLKIGQRGLSDRIPAAHAGPILGLDWISPSASSPSAIRPNAWYNSGSALGLLDELIPGSGTMSGNTGAGDAEGSSIGWLASGGLDRCVKVWDLTVPPGRSHAPHKPAYTLRTSFPVRRVSWRAGYECELAIVPTADFGSGGSAEVHNASGAAAAVSVVGGGTGLLSVMSSPRIGSATLKLPETANDTGGGSHAVPRNATSDPIEIWDVRRGFLSKWTVNDSAGEGGVTDIAFADSHTLLAQHSSGAFSQFDLRYSSKTLDAVPRLAMAWDASNCLAFVADRPRKWEIPYDDLDPEKSQNIQGWQGNIKSLGDAPFAPVSQTMGTFTYEESDDDLATFIKLAQGYIYEGADKRSICSHNAQVSLNAGKIEAAQAWLLLDSLLTDLALEPPPSPPPPLQPLPHSTSAPAALPTVNTIPAPQRSVSSNSDVFIKGKDPSPVSRSKYVTDGPSTTISQSPQKITPTSSTTSSPRHMSNSLPQLPTTLSRRESSMGIPLSLRPRLFSSNRRPSFAHSIQSTHSDSPSDGTKSQTSLKGIGEGALEDSDSSESEDDHDGLGDDLQVNSDEEGPSLRKPSSNLHTRMNTPQPSPLSQVVRQQAWTEDEREGERDEREDEDTPSPGSTSESDSSDTSPRRQGTRRSMRKSARSHTRSRSSTMASFAVSSQRGLVKQESYNSIHTIVADTTPGRRDEDAGDLFTDPVGAHPQDLTQSNKTSPYHHRAGSEAFSSEYLPTAGNSGGGKGAQSIKSAKLDAAHYKAVQEAESRYREVGWITLREIFESFANIGDVQICALLSVISPEELKIHRMRRLRFIEAYIEILSRVRLHIPAAYMRKYVDEEEIRANTALQTTIYTSCGRCRKPIVTPAIADLTYAGKPSGGYSYCLACRQTATMCSICHLPVRALMFKCPVCMHGGHQECYRNYYMHRPLVELTLPAPLEPPRPPRSSTLTPDTGTIPRRRGRAISRSASTTGDSDGGSDDSMGVVGSGTTAGGSFTEQARLTNIGRSLHGHPCAAGCGHHCWAAIKQLLSGQ